MERRLTTILSADVAGYSRLMERDEAGTLTELMERETGIVNPLLAGQEGRIVKTLGDGFLAEFSRPISAVRFAAEMQQASEARNAGIPEDRRMSFRIGIHLAEVIEDQNDVFGEGVDVASRLQAVAEPGGIFISEAVHQQVKGQLAYIFEDAGKRQLKDSSGLTQAYRVRDGEDGTPAPGRKRSAAAHQASIAVLPFLNMSGDPEQDYFSDGITEDIITDLSKISALFVVSRNTAFSFKGQTEDIDRIAARLGVQYVLEGSVRKVNDRVRITAQLIDGRTNGHVWAERYDRKFDDIFELQDDISHAIVDALRLRMLPKERETISQRPTFNSEAYRFYLMGRSFFHRGHTRRYLRLAKQMFQRALDIDPDYAAAHAGIADCNSHLLDAGDTTITTNEIFEQSERALALDQSLAEAHASKGLALYTAGRYEEAEANFERAIALKPELFEGYFFYGRNCFNRGQFGKAAALFGKAAEFKSDDFRALGLQSMCYQSLGRLEDMRTAARRALTRAEAAIAERPDDADALAFGAGLLAVLGETERTKDWAERASIIEPDDFYMHYNIACAFAILGEKELALDRLERIMGPATLRSLREFMLHDSDLDVLRDHPRYAGILKKLGD
ncbi:adenylate/guanylate cyclase domain-containing protein [Aestuariivirga sp.]|uniref:adenylate/guanylate cyclase domain-containing protein n=1 Tax=Aestuariivirga sp. TaxID=2650926 RepID=UPI00391A440D